MKNTLKNIITLGQSKKVDERIEYHNTKLRKYNDKINPIVELRERLEQNVGVINSTVKYIYDTISQDFIELNSSDSLTLQKLSPRN